MRKFQQYLYACGGLLTETTNALDVLRAEDLILLSHIVRAVSQSPPDVDDETEEAILRVPVSPKKTSSLGARKLFGFCFISSERQPMNRQWP